MFLAGNQLGKTWAGGCETAIHLTGRYPDWWRGRKYDRPVRGWAAGITTETTRDNPQRILLGPPEDRGTGAIPGDLIERVDPGRGLPNIVDSILVRHVTGGISSLAFKSYERGREKWQGETLDFVWYDEEPPEDIYLEGLTRTNATKGLVWLTCTPLLGMSQVVTKFYPVPATDDRFLVQMQIEEAEHFTPAERDRIIASYPPHEAEARARGIPMLRGGRIYLNFDPFRNVRDDLDAGGNPLLVGMDFNVNPMCAMVGYRAGDQLHVVDEIVLNDSHTEEMSKEIRARYPAPRHVTVYPDPTGNKRVTSAGGQTDFSILRSHGFIVVAPPAAPPVADRINEVNSLAKGSDGKRRLYVHPRCKRVIASLSNQSYKEGTSQPDKDGGWDHMNDALGYLVHSEFPIIQYERKVVKLVGR